MNNSNYGYPPSGYTSPYSSTPSNIRPYRPRFGFSGPSLYPRPRSSASKPNPDSYSDSMSNNFGNSTSRIDNYNSDAGADSYNNSFKNESSSSYYSTNDSYYPEQPSDETSMQSAARSNMGFMRENSLLYGTKPPPHVDTFSQPRYPYSSLSLGMNNNEGFPKPYSTAFGLGNRQSFSARKFGKVKRRGMASKQGAWKCQLCNLDFTSQIPYDMHLRGARHAKKVKANQASMDATSQAGEGGDNTLFCAVCNVKANSSLQYQTHLEGTKHKNKLNPKDPKEQTAEGQTKKEKKKDKKSAAATNGKTNGTLTRSLPSDFGEPQPAKLMKFSCDICSLSVNSDVQLQQHLSSKKHQNKVEGKPVVKVRKNKAENNPSDGSFENMDTSVSGEAAQKVVGVKTLASSFVQGGTLQ